ncbi:phage major capsid protein [Nocardioides pyridinolyticus]
MDFRSMAEAALDRRAALHETYRSIRAKHDAAKDAGKSDAAKAHRDHLDALEADMDDLAAEARQYVEQAEAEQNRAAGKDHAERSHVLRAATRTESRNAEVRANEPLPEGRSFADLTAKPASLREFGEYARSLAYGEKRMSEDDPTQGGYLVPPRYAAAVLDLARNATRVIEAGATVVPMDSNDVTVAKVVGDPEPDWRNEKQAIASGDLGLGALNLKAKSLAVLVKAPFELVEDAANLGDVLGNSLAGAFGVKLDHTSLYGSGVDPEPAGLITEALNTSTYPLAGLSSWDEIIAAVADVRGRNFDPRAALMSEDNLAALSTLRATADGQYLTPPQYVENVRRMSSGNMGSEIAVGDFRNLYIGIRTSFEIKVLNERFADTGEIGFIGWLRADVQQARPGAFHVISQATA